MMLYRFISFSILIFLQQITFAQTFLKGKIHKAGSDSIGAYVTVTNITKAFVQLSSANGVYSIEANDKDKIVFSYVGYASDTVIVEQQLLITGYDAYLAIGKAVTLLGVTVTGNYRIDSLERRKYYENIYNKQTKITGGNAPADGFGIVFSPVSFFSKSGKQTRGLKKRLKKQEENYFIDYVFSPAWVSSITGLKGDSLRLFMYQHRPSYKFCRDKDRTTLILYINDRLKEFRNPKKQ